MEMRMANREADARMLMIRASRNGKPNMVAL